MSEPGLRRILYVEDDADIREIVRMSLEKLGGFRVAVCDSCTQAMDVVDEFNPNLLLLDVMMPGVDGPATLKRLRERVSAESAPAIFITAKVEAGAMARYRDMGVLDVIVKPFDPMVLSKRIEHIWQQHQSGSHDVEGDEFERQLTQRSAVFVAQLPQQVQNLNDDLTAWLSAPQEAGLLENLNHKVHRLKGSGGTFGCSGISDLSRGLEESLVTLQAGRVTSGQVPALDKVEAMMEALREEVNRICGKPEKGSHQRTPF